MLLTVQRGGSESEAGGWAPRGRAHFLTSKLHDVCHDGNETVVTYTYLTSCDMDRSTRSIR